ncbi:MAG TPA: hypothetical protein VLA40_00710, partial [Rheinheimera sp.]|nr:hypothetical protein [Rheinheimera sp.]
MRILLLIIAVAIFSPALSWADTATEVTADKSSATEATPAKTDDSALPPASQAQHVTALAAKNEPPAERPTAGLGLGKMALSLSIVVAIVLVLGWLFKKLTLRLP